MSKPKDAIEGLFDDNIFINETLYPENLRNDIPKPIEVTVVGTKYTEVVAEYIIVDVENQKFIHYGVLCLDIYNFVGDDIEPYVHDILSRKKLVKAEQKRAVILKSHILRDIVEIEDKEDLN